MDIVELTRTGDERKMTAGFGGLNRHMRISEGEFADCRNMTGDEYPTATVRLPRREIKFCTDVERAHPVDMYTKVQIRDCLTVNGCVAVLDGENNLFFTSADEGTGTNTMRHWHVSYPGVMTVQGKQMAAFGKGIYVIPSGMWVPDTDSDEVCNTKCVINGRFNIEMTDGDGGRIIPMSDKVDAVDGDYFAEDGKLYKYIVDGDIGEWIAVGVYHVLLVPTDGNVHVFDGLRVSDVVEVTGMGAVKISDISTTDGNVYLQIDTICEIAEDVELTVERRLPILDFAVEHDNRLWGCRYGKNDKGEFVNEIYASKQGDPMSWFTYQGIADDSFTVSVGEPGEWTGCGVCGDHVVFFKENCIVTVYGDMPSDYTTELTYCDGVIKTGGSSKRTVTNINGVLYYRSYTGIFRLESGSLPVCISDALGRKNVYGHTVFDYIGGTDGRRFFIDMVRNEEIRERVLYVYDTYTGRWYAENSVPNVRHMARFEDSVMFICAETKTGDEYNISYVQIANTGFNMSYPVPAAVAILDNGELLYPENDKYPSILYTGYAAEQDIEWYFDSGDYGLDDPEYKRVKAIEIRAYVANGAYYDVYIQYDRDGQWHMLVPRGADRRFGTTRVKYLLRRCDTYKLRLKGKGEVSVFSIVHTYESQGDRAYDS